MKNRKPDGQRNDYGGHGKHLHETMNDVLMSDKTEVEIPDTGKTMATSELAIDLKTHTSTPSHT